MRCKNGTCIDRADGIHHDVTVSSGSNIDLNVLGRIQIVVEFFVFFPGMRAFIVFLPVENEDALGIIDVLPFGVLTVRHFPEVLCDEVIVCVQLGIHDQRVGIDRFHWLDDFSFLTFGDLFSRGDPERVLAFFVFILRQLEIL